jgi:threonine/homoserine efflux transporter RhtA
MLAPMAVGEVRPGYELWHPNREKPQVQTTRAFVVLLLLATAGIVLLVTIGGWSLLQGGVGMAFISLIYAVLYLVFAVMVARWSRGALTVSAAFSILLLIFAAVAAPSWFARDKSGFDTALLPDNLIGLLLILLIPLQVLVIVVGLIAFNQDWHVEEERPIGSGEDYGAEPPPDEGAPLPA